MKLHPQNSTPGEVNTTPDIKPVTIGELVEVIELMLGGIAFQRSYYLSAANKRLEDIKKRL